MASVTLTLTEECSGGNHLTLTMTGAVSGSRVYDITEVQEIIDRVGREELAAAIIRLAKVGRTNSQLKAVLQAGITVTI
jgi:hypothetical protein